MLAYEDPHENSEVFSFKDNAWTVTARMPVAGLIAARATTINNRVLLFGDIDRFIFCSDRNPRNVFVICPPVCSFQACLEL